MKCADSDAEVYLYVVLVIGCLFALECCSPFCFHFLKKKLATHYVAAIMCVMLLFIS